MSFHIQSQSAGLINNVDGDQHITGGQSGTLTSLDTVRDAARILQQALAVAPFHETAAMRHYVDAIAAEIQRPVPDRRTVADRVRRLVDLVSASAPIASLGIAIAGPLRTLAEWLGDLGTPILRILT